MAFVSRSYNHPPNWHVQSSKNCHDQPSLKAAKWLEHLVKTYMGFIFSDDIPKEDLQQFSVIKKESS